MLQVAETLCPCGPDWASIVTAVATAVLAIGVIFAAAQFFAERRASRAAETGALLQEWDDERLQRWRYNLDCYEDIEVNRTRAWNAYRELDGRELKTVNDLVRDLSRVADRIEVYIRTGAADTRIVAEHIGYDVVSPYYTLQNVLQSRASEGDFNFDGYRDLALRIQDYARLHRLEADLPKQLVFANLPLIRYRHDISQGYRKAVFVAFRLWLLKVFEGWPEQEDRFPAQDTERAQAVADVPPS